MPAGGKFLMASNSQSTIRHLGPPLSLDDGATVPGIGELILARFSKPLQVEEIVEDEATFAGTDLPPASGESSPQHFVFITGISPGRDGVLLDVFPVLFSTKSDGDLAAYNRFNDAAKATLLPLPPLSRRHPTPEAFGGPLELGNWPLQKDSWLSIVSRQFILPYSRPFRRMNPPLTIPFLEFNRIFIYRKTLCLNGQTTHTPDDDQTQSQDDPEGSTLRPTAIDGNIGGILAAEGVDADEGPNATMLDDLRVLASTQDPIWVEELRRYLGQEEKERDEMKTERAVRLTRWREDVI